MTIITTGNRRRGIYLTVCEQREVLGAFVHRFTKEHFPNWAREPRPDGSAYPVQFASDADWLANTWFATREDGLLDRRFRCCDSQPTWPDNPELRTSRAA